MTPLLHPELINDPFGDPGVYVDFLYDRRALLLDLGDLGAMAPRKLLRVTHAFVSHTHMDHFCGFDCLLRVVLGRPKRIHVTGPAGFIGKLEHKLSAYSWNLASQSAVDLCIDAHELGADNRLQTARFRFSSGFAREDLPVRTVPGGVLLDESNLVVRAVELDHRIACLAFSVEEKKHFNVWRNEVADMGLGVGPWLHKLKQAVMRGDPDDVEITARWRENGIMRQATHPLHMLRKKLLKITPGQKVSYVTDAGYTLDNVGKIIDLVDRSDLLFIESPFLHEDADIAERKMHLTARQAGEIARRAHVRRFEQFHFSLRYEGQGERLRQEGLAAFSASEVASDPDINSKKAL
jgi:ribonuclease Z